MNQTDSQHFCPHGRFNTSPKARPQTYITAHKQIDRRYQSSEICHQTYKLICFCLTGWAHYDIDWLPYLFSSVINDRLLYKTGKRLMENYISRRLQGSAAPCAAPSAIIMPALRSYATPSASRSATAACRCRNRSFRKCEWAWADLSYFSDLPDLADGSEGRWSSWWWKIFSGNLVVWVRIYIFATK